MELFDAGQFGEDKNLLPPSVLILNHKIKYGA